MTPADFDRLARELIELNNRTPDKSLAELAAAALRSVWNAALEEAATVFTEQRDWDMRAEVLAKKLPEDRR